MSDMFDKTITILLVFPMVKLLCNNQCYKIFVRVVLRRRINAKYIFLYRIYFFIFIILS